MASCQAATIRAGVASSDVLGRIARIVLFALAREATAVVAFSSSSKGFLPENGVATAAAGMFNEQTERQCRFLEKTCDENTDILIENERLEPLPLPNSLRN